MSNAAVNDNEGRHDLLARAVKYAVDRHKGTNRKGTRVPYIVHPMETAAIAAGMTDDVNVIAAAVLHDTVEDTDATIEDIRREFGDRVAQLVGAESENKRPDQPEADTWELRKQETILHLLKEKDRDVLIIALSDKLSNIQALHRDYMKFGDKIWSRFNQQNPSMQKWYYENLKQCFEPLKNTQAYMEYTGLMQEVFGRYPARAKKG